MTSRNKIESCNAIYENNMKAPQNKFWSWRRPIAAFKFDHIVHTHKILSPKSRAFNKVQKHDDTFTEPYQCSNPVWKQTYHILSPRSDLKIFKETFIAVKRFYSPTFHPPQMLTHFLIVAAVSPHYVFFWPKGRRNHASLLWKFLEETHVEKIHVPPFPP